ncbi:MAG TPA: hypothetical protein VL003_04325 [Pusillimonas sp.]|uniref:hypothetical protein n=1 Tax=Pusillimonas sp. TaxID=3040095 RepID=UPI002BFD37AA|nr:hypothetical protein [Pusillimonas sp.]HUH87260.1 hypothetical protein [Pusillimonas sp.]
MHIVLPGALPDTEAARALVSHLPQAAPTFVTWLSRARATLQAIDSTVSGCTAYEQWQLERAGFRPEPQQNLAAGLGPLWAITSKPAADRPIWLAELVHMAPTQTSTAMLVAQDLHITPEQSLALFESAQTLFEGTGFHLHANDEHRWRVEMTDECRFLCASPALVASTAVNDWWLKQAPARPWRRLLNELQMLWFDHPVNLARQGQGLPPINGIWLFGGARPEQLKAASPAVETRVYETLHPPFMAQDWAGWLGALAELEAQVFAPLALQDIQPTLVLTGRAHLVSLEPKAMARWTQWLPGSRTDWSKWWSYRN